MTKRWSLVACLVAAGVLLPQGSEACLRRRVRPVQKIDHKLASVSKAEQLLARGKHAAAAKKAKRTYKHFLAATGEPSVGKALYNRAQRAIALATVRTDGALDLGRGMRGKTPQSRAENLAWATSVLEVQAAADPDNVIARTNFAEALAHDPIYESWALDMLSDLSNDDLMPTARGYALMASLQARRGDTVGKEVSLERCRELGADDEVCTASV